MHSATAWMLLFMLRMTKFLRFALGLLSALPLVTSAESAWARAPSPEPPQCSFSIPWKRLTVPLNIPGLPIGAVQGGEEKLTLSVAASPATTVRVQAFGAGRVLVLPNARAGDTFSLTVSGTCSTLPAPPSVTVEVSYVAEAPLPTQAGTLRELAPGKVDFLPSPELVPFLPVTTVLFNPLGGQYPLGHAPSPGDTYGVRICYGGRCDGLPTDDPKAEDPIFRPVRLTPSCTMRDGKERVKASGLRPHEIEVQAYVHGVDANGRLLRTKLTTQVDCSQVTDEEAKVQNSGCALSAPRARGTSALAGIGVTLLLLRRSRRRQRAANTRPFRA